ncbi:hypothetical protein [Chlorobium ferrooxidans]|uniref:Type I restriction modification enzyme methylase subunit n=1 Tax=Chlorobium ferrooxidans DSM 13031 TaxID=377431 RepID=Q0YPX6_9CHLB|nr:hypothetical protein [Chlorobium ferrooxidans]EAT58353.1 type I restriction modification enzyme methylase subunit [Chlorobium ferrooxidans DSM 13031]
MDDKRTKLEGNGDLKDNVAKYHARLHETESDRTLKCFFVLCDEIEAEGYDLSLSCYKTDVFEEVSHENPSVILDKLIAAVVGEIDGVELANIQSGIVRELLELKGMIG